MISCKKSSNDANTTKPLNDLEQKILGKWNFDNAGGSHSISGYWLFKSTVIDSLTTATATFRELELRTTGACPVFGFWSLNSDSSLKCTCISPDKIVMLTADTLIFRHYYGAFRLDYVWKR